MANFSDKIVSAGRRRNAARQRKAGLSNQHTRRVRYPDGAVKSVNGARDLLFAEIYFRMESAG
jgi:hypothetical protein